MRQSILPFYKTGWFFLMLIGGSALLWWSGQNGIVHFESYQQHLFDYMRAIIGKESIVVELDKKVHQNNILIYLVELIPWFCWISGSFILWLIHRAKQRFQLLSLLAYILLLLLTQLLIITSLIWFKLFPVAIGLLFSWLIMGAYRWEKQSVNQLSRNHNQLVSELLLIYYQSGQSEKMLPILVQSQADIKLVEKVYEMVLLVDSKREPELAQKLLNWILETGIHHFASENKKVEFLRRDISFADKNAKHSSPENVDCQSLESPTEVSTHQFQAEDFNDTEEILDRTMVIGETPSQATTLSSICPVDHFGRYQVEGVLGKGAMGIVYQGVDPKINRYVAIKTLQLNRTVDDENLEQSKSRFFREAEMAGNLSHANIVTIYDVGEEGELGYIAMDLLTGAPLSEFVRPDNRLPIPLVYQLMIQIADALDYAHQQSVVHRDIKPANIIYDDEIQRVTVTDFGIAYITDNSHTGTGTVMGSPYYMSPEQVSGERVDGRSDIFSLGVTFYQLLSGRLPFNGETLASVTHNITKSKPVSVKQWDENLPPSAARITNKAMHKNVEKRFQTMQEFKLVLTKALKRDFKKVPFV